MQNSSVRVREIQSLYTLRVGHFVNYLAATLDFLSTGGLEREIPLFLQSLSAFKSIDRLIA